MLTRLIRAAYHDVAQRFQQTMANGPSTPQTAGLTGLTVLWSAVSSISSSPSAIIRPDARRLTSRPPTWPTSSAWLYGLNFGCAALVYS